MRILIRQFARLLGAAALLYAIALAVSYAIVPAQKSARGIDTAQAARTLYMTEPKYVFLDRGTLNTTRDKVILLGASNVVAGFRRDEMQGLVQRLQVNNLGVGGSNLTQVAQIADLVLDAQSSEARSHNTFVIGLWYGLFADDKVRWYTPDRHAGDTDIDIERYRYGFFRRSDNGPVANIPARWQDVGLTLIHPLLVVDRLARDATAALRRDAAGKAPVLTDAQRNAATVSPAQQQRYLRFWSDYMGSGGVSNAQFERLQALVERLSASGARVVLVDLPIPEWHEKASPHHADYARRVAQLSADMRDMPGVTLISLRTSRDGSEFSDEVHPKPRVASQWTAQLASALNTVPTQPEGEVPMLAGTEKNRKPAAPITTKNQEG